MSLGVGFAFEAELATAFTAVELAFEKHWVRHLLGHMTLIVSHIFREGNASADRLTREPMNSFEWWDHVPAFLDSFLRCDRHEEFYRFSGFPTTRFLTRPWPLDRSVVLWL
ncbi:hypothetical protein ACS0TY_029478 [Phlomoides rotata]